MDHRIGESRAYWDRHARTDPMWAVLSDPAKKGKWNLQEFMANGEREMVGPSLQPEPRAYTHSHGGDPPSSKR